MGSLSSLFSQNIYLKVSPSRLLIQSNGFSLVEVLVSLIIVSLAAVNITGLQRKIAAQQRDNISHAAVLAIATEKMETAFSFETAQQLMAMHNVSETSFNDMVGELTINWQVTSADETSSLSDDFKEIRLTVFWENNSAQTQSFTYSSGINFGSLLSSASTVDEIAEMEQTSSIIVSALSNNEVLYFEPNMSYQTGSFVIFDSYLYQATKYYAVGDAYPHSARDQDSGIALVGEGWQSFGAVNNVELKKLENLVTTF